MDDKDNEEVKFPEPPDNARCKTAVWKAGKKIERIHSSQFTAIQFNPGLGNARFSPLVNEGIGNVPTIYGGENLSVAIMETVLHNPPTPCTNYPVDLASLGGLSHSQLIPNEDLIIVDLNPRTIKKLGATQAQLLGCGADHYHQTQLWASKLYSDNPEAHGLQWPSKQHGDKALILFSTRLRSNNLRVSIESENIAISHAILNELKVLAFEMDLILF